MTATAEHTTPIELFGHTWDPTDTPDGFAAAVAWMAAHALDTGTETP